MIEHEVYIHPENGTVCENLNKETIELLILNIYRANL